MGKSEIDNGIGKTSIDSEINGDIDVDNGIGDINLNQEAQEIIVSKAMATE